jgi:hypothetical protein
MTALPDLPGWIALDGPWAGSVHFIDHPENEEQDTLGPVEILVISREDQSGTPWLQEIRFMIAGASGLPKPEKFNRINLAPGGWLSSLIPQDAPSQFIDTASITDSMSRTMSKRLLTGHIVALRFHELLAARQVLEDLAAPGTSENVLKLVVNKQDESVTKATSRLYKELTQWGEVSSAMLLAELEGVSVVTIRNRLQSARKSGDLESPGSGARR